MPELLLNKWIAKIKKEWKIAFFSSLFIGLFTHIYLMTNMLPNHDGLINTHHSQMKFESGRFFLSPFSGIGSFFDLPLINGTLAILFLALMSIVLVEIFEIKKTLSIVLISGLIVTFPTVGATFSYMFTVDGYMAGYLLAVLAILITQKWKYGFIIGSLIFYLSVGIYQANLAVFLMVITVWFIREIITQRSPIGVAIRLLIRQITTVTIGMALYAITFKAYQTIFGGQITDYQGLTEIGKQSDSLTDQFLKIKDTFMEFFFRGLISDAPVNLFEILNVMLFILIIVAVFLAIWQSNGAYKFVQILIAVAGLAVLPILAYILYFVSEGVTYHMLMIMSLAIIYMIPIIIYDTLHLPNPIVNWFSWSTVIISFVIIFNFAVINNIAYFNMTLKYERSYAMVNRVLDRMEQTDGYEEVKQMAFIGRVRMHTAIHRKVSENIPQMTGAVGEHFLIEPYHYKHMLENQFGMLKENVDADTLETLKESKMVRQMGIWPSKDAVQIIDDIIIIKLAD